MIDATCTFEELFEAISNLEGHAFAHNEEYYQSSRVLIETVDGFSEVNALITKFAKMVNLILDDGSIIRCADKHILFCKDGEIFADSVEIGTHVKTKNGFSKVISAVHTGEINEVFDVEVKNEDHAYVTANGVVHHNTSITAALSHVYAESGHNVITIVPSSDLVDQTASWYEMLGMDVGIYSGERKDIEHSHVVATWQALQYNPQVLERFTVVIWDEAHGIKSAVAAKLLNDYGKHIPFRFGVTGTFPKPDADKMSLESSVGSIFIDIPAKWLMDNGYLAKVEIQPIEINEMYIDEEFPDYDSERAFLSKSPARMEKIADLIISQCATHGNTLVLVNSIPFGKKLSALIKDSVFLYGESAKDLRKEHYDLFEERDDLIVIASSGIASTGISIDRIFCLLLIDPGKSFIKAIQSIGRGLRKSRDKDFVSVVDVHSKLKWARKHFRERKKHYDEASYPVAKKAVLKVKGE